MTPLPPHRPSDIAHSRAQSESEAVHRLIVGRDTVTRALRRAEAFACATGLSRDPAERLALVVEEWVSNVVEHGEAPPGATIVLRLRRTPDCVRLTISDPGMAFDPRAAVFQGPNLERGGGAGLALIRAWCRIADYRRQRRRNRLVLEIPLS